jgi:inner membrane protein
VDPLTQSLLGAVTAHAALAPRLGRIALLIGAVGGELADADVLLDPWVDPALPFALHRHFTHSLVAIPVGGLIAAAPFLLFPALRAKAGAVIAAATIAFATHGLLDNCTSYGTHLLWPFWPHRTAWDSMSIIDPIFTGVLFLGLVIALIRGSGVPARAALAIALSHIGLGFVQHGRAAAVQQRLAEIRGHTPHGARVMPTLGNIVLWRSVYEHDGRLWADAIRVGPLSEARVRVGTSVPRFTADDLPERTSERTRHVFGRFEAFATGFMAVIEHDPGPGIALGDMRYGLPPESMRPIWGMRITHGGEDVHFNNFEFEIDARTALADLWSDIRGTTSAYVPIDALAH